MPLTPLEQELLVALRDSSDALNDAIVWMESFALPHLGEECDGGNILQIGLQMRIDENAEVIARTEQAADTAPPAR